MGPPANPRPHQAARARPTRRLTAARPPPYLRPATRHRTRPANSARPPPQLRPVSALLLAYGPPVPASAAAPPNLRPTSALMLAAGVAPSWGQPAGRRAGPRRLKRLLRAARARLRTERAGAACPTLTG